MERCRAITKMVFRIELHEDDARCVLDLCRRHEIDPSEFIKIGTMRYVDNILRYREAPPGRVLCELQCELRKWQRSG